MNFLNGASPRTGFPALGGIGRRSGIQDALQEVLQLLDSAQIGPASLLDWFRCLTGEELAIMYARSVERASHFKWFLGESANGYVIWLHEYKPTELPDAVGSFAASVHNHRYSFVSKIITGSLLVSDFTLDRVQRFPMPSGTRRLSAPTTYLLGSEQIHRIDITAPSTCTLVVQGPPERAYSTVFDLKNKSFHDLYDLPSRFPRLLSVLGAS